MAKPRDPWWPLPKVLWDQLSDDIKAGLAMPLHHDRQGKPLEVLEWSALMEDPKYRIVAEDRLPDGSALHTNWWGLDSYLHGPPWGRPPLIFETTYCEARRRCPDDGCRHLVAAIIAPPGMRRLTRYPTEALANECHALYLERLRNGWRPGEDE